MLSTLLHSISIPKIGRPPAYVEPPAYEKPTAFGKHDDDELIKTAADDTQQRFEEWLQNESQAFEARYPGLEGNEQAFTRYLKQRHPESERMFYNRIHSVSLANRETTHLVQNIEQSLGLSNPYQAAGNGRLSQSYPITRSGRNQFSVIAQARRESRRIPAEDTFSYSSRFGNQGMATHTQASAATMERTYSRPLLSSNDGPVSIQMDAFTLGLIRRQAIEQQDASHLRELMARGMTQRQLLEGASNNERLQVMGLVRRQS
jgi:hypothetical protein